MFYLQKDNEKGSIKAIIIRVKLKTIFISVIPSRQNKQLT